MKSLSNIGSFNFEEGYLTCADFSRGGHSILMGSSTGRITFCCIEDWTDFGSVKILDPQLGF
jgi:WD40 repeat protein